MENLDENKKRKKKSTHEVFIPYTYEKPNQIKSNYY